METATNSRRRKTLVLLTWCLPLVLAWSLWLYHLDASDLTFDEAATYFVARRPLLDILEYLRGAVREHPPIYYLLVHGWMTLAGASEFSLRFFSVGMGLIALTLTGRLARLTIPPTSPLTQFVATTMLAVVPGMAYYARDARMYSLGTVWTLLSAILFLRGWAGTRAWPRRAALVGLTTIHCLALLTHYYLLLPILAQPLVLLITRRWRPFLAWCAIHSVPALVGLTWLRLAPGLQMTTNSLWPHLAIIAPTRFRIFHLLGKTLFSPVLGVHFHLLYILLALTAVGVLLALWRRRAVGVWLALVLTLPPALAFALPQPPAPRYLAFLTPIAILPLTLLCVTPLHLIRNPQPAIRRLTWGATLGLTLLVALLLITGGLYHAITFDRSHYGRTLETVKAHARPGDGVLFYGPWQRIQFRYYDPGGLPPIKTLPPHAPPHLQPDEAEPVLERMLAKYDRLWVIPAAVDDVDPAHFVEGWLYANTHTLWKTDDFSLHLPPLPPDAPTRRLELTFGQTLSLQRLAYEPQPVPAGEPLRLTLYWTPLRSLELQGDVRLALALADREGHVWNVAYSTPGAWASPSSTWQPGQIITDYEGLMTPQGAPPGEYVVRLMATDSATGEPLLAAGRKEADLLTVEITEPARAPILHGLPHPDAATFCPPALSTVEGPALSEAEGPVLSTVEGPVLSTVEGPDEAACLTLAGYEPGGLRFQQGYPAPVTLHWLLQPTTLPEVRVRLRVSHHPVPLLPDWRVTRVVTRTLPLAPPDSTVAPLPSPAAQADSFRIMLPLVTRASPSPPSGAVAARLLTLPTVLTLPPDAPTGPARVTLEVVGPDGNPWPTTEGDSAIPLFDFTIESRPVLRRLPNGLTPIQANFGDEVGLRGYRVTGNPRPGGQLHLTYAWYARTRPTAIYAVFNHLMTADGVLVAQADGWPQEGRMLTTQWQAGEYIEDSYTLAIPPDAPPGPYTLYVGLYDAATNERQPVFQDNRRLPEDRVPIPLPDEEEE